MAAAPSTSPSILRLATPKASASRNHNSPRLCCALSNAGKGICESSLPTRGRGIKELFMPIFDEVRFPPAISRGSSGGPERQTEIVALASGREERNSRHAHSRRRYNAGFGVATLDDIHAVVAFFE